MPVKPIPDGYHAVTPYLIVKDAASAIEFYTRAFGAVERFRMADHHGRIGHAEIQVGSSIVLLCDEFPEMDAVGPTTRGGSTVTLLHYVEDVDATFARALDAGATATFPVADHFYGDRMGILRDPFGHVWYVTTHIEDVTPDEIKRRFEAMAPQPA